MWFSLINQHFLKVWQQHDPPVGRKNRGLISLMRRHQWHLNDDQHANLMHYLAGYPVLQQLYVAKQRWCGSCCSGRSKGAGQSACCPVYSTCWIWFRDSPLRALARTLTSWLQPLVAMWRFSKSNAHHGGLPQQDGNDLQEGLWF